MLKWILSVITFLAVDAHSQEASKIVAVVNDRLIAQSDLQHRVNMALLSSGMEKNAENIKHISPQILQMMIDEILQQELGDKFKIEITKADIDRMIQAIEVQNNMEPGGMQKLFENNGIPMEVMHAHLKARQVWQDYIKAKYADSIAISPQEVRTYLDNIKKAKNQPHFLLAEIFLPFGEDKSEKEALKHATVLAEKIRRGAHFSAVAQEFSRLPSAARGGDIGWVTLESLEPAIRTSVASLASGQVSSPIRVEGGFYLILLRDRQENGQNIGKETFLTFQQALFPVSLEADREVVEQVFLRAKTFAHQARSCSAASSLLKSNKNIKTQQISKAPLSHLPTELRKLLLSLDKDKPSSPLLTPEGILIFWLCAKEDYNPQEPTEEEVKGLLMERKLGMLAQRELRHLHRGAVITVRN